MDLGALGGFDLGSGGIAVNSAGEVAGVYTGTSPQGYRETRFFFWSAATGILDVGTLGYRHITIHDMNEHGQILGEGSSDKFPSAYFGFVWSPGTGHVELNGPDASWTYAVAINNSGECVGQIGYPRAERPPYAFHAALWTVPPVLTSEQQIVRLAAELESLAEAGVLEPGQAQGLSRKLDAALDRLAQGNTAAACNNLGAFVNMVEALVRSRRLPEDAGQELIAAAAGAVECP